MTITGTNLTGASDVEFGATPAASYTVDNDTQITATSPAESAGTVDITVTTPVGGTSATNAGDQYTFVAAPTVTSVSPTSGSDAGGTSVTITGTGFNGASDVEFGATPAASYTVDNDTQITATSPAAADGTVDITVTTPGGTSATSAADQYTFTPVVAGCSSNCITIGDRSQLEGDTANHKMAFNVTLSDPSTSNVTVQYDVLAGSATGGTKPGAGVDFKLASKTLVFKVNAKTGLTPVSKTINVTVYGDTTVEPDETFTVVLSNPSGGYTLNRDTGTGTILNDDGGPSGTTVGIADGSTGVQHSGKQTFKMLVTLSAKATGTVTVDYTITEGSATYTQKDTGGDFGGKLTKTLTFKAGQSAKSIAIPIWADPNPDTDETFTVTLSNLTGAGTSLLQSSATGTILGLS